MYVNVARFYIIRIFVFRENNKLKFNVVIISIYGIFKVVAVFGSRRGGRRGGWVKRFFVGSVGFFLGLAWV